VKGQKAKPGKTYMKIPICLLTGGWGFSYMSLKTACFFTRKGNPAGGGRNVLNFS
jgi:hypothetical protein